MMEHGTPSLVVKITNFSFVPGGATGHALKGFKGTLMFRVTRIGTCVPARDGMTVLDRMGQRISFHGKGHDHFRSR